MTSIFYMLIYLHFTILFCDNVCWLHIVAK